MLDYYQLRTFNDKACLKEMVKRKIGTRTMVLLCGMDERSLAARLKEFKIKKKPD